MTSSKSTASTSSWLGLVAAVIGVLLLVPALAQAGGRKRVVVLELEGPKAEKFHEDLVKLIKKSHTVVPVEKWNSTADDLDASGTSEKNLKKVAKKLKVDAIVTGKIDKRRDEYIIKLKLRLGKTGGLVGEGVDTKADGPRIDGKAAKDLRDELIDLIGNVDANRAGRDDEEEEDDKPAKKKSVADDDDEEEEDKPVKKGFSKKNDEEEDKPVKKGFSKKTDEEEDKPAKKGFSKKTDEDEEEDKPAKKGFSKKTDDEEEEDKPAKKGFSKKTDDEEEEDKPAKKKPVVAAKADEDEDPVPKSKKKPVAEDEDEEEVDEDEDAPEKKVASKDEDEDEDEDGGSVEEDSGEEEAAPMSALSPGERAVDAVIGLSLNARRMSFTTEPGLATEPPPYKGVPVAGLLIDATVFPGAIGHKRKGMAKNFGVTVMLDKVIKISSEANGMKLPTTQARYAIGAVFRYPIGKLTVGATLRVGRQNFTVDVGAVTPPPDIANVNYTIIDPSLFLRYPVTPKVLLNVNLGFMLVTNTGQIQNGDQFGPATVSGFEGEIGGDYLLTKNIFARAAFKFETIGYKFRGGAAKTNLKYDAGADNTQDVFGARDSYLGGAVTVGYLY